MTANQSDITDVIFKVFPEGDVIAFFPGLAATSKSWQCLSYHEATRLLLVSILIHSVRSNDVITLERCRSHNRNSSPAEFEPVQTFTSVAEAVKELWSYEIVCSANGDAFRLTRHGVELVVLSESEVVEIA